MHSWVGRKHGRLPFLEHGLQNGGAYNTRLAARYGA
jgi:hypothetical protein